MCVRYRPCLRVLSSMLAFSSSEKPRKLRTQSWKGGTLESVRNFSSSAWKDLGKQLPTHIHSLTQARVSKSSRQNIYLNGQVDFSYWMDFSHTHTHTHTKTSNQLNTALAFPLKRAAVYIICIVTPYTRGWEGAILNGIEFREISG